MAGDLAGTPNCGVHVQSCNDAHIHNFGIYASTERRIVYDVNDFDETLPAPWEFDLKRLAASIVLDGRQQGFSENDVAEVVETCVRDYALEMTELAHNTSLAIHYARMDEKLFFAMPLPKSVAKRSRKQIKQARKRSSMQVLKKLCVLEAGRYRFVDDPPKQLRFDDEGRERMHTMYNRYRDTLRPDRGHLLGEYRFRDAARRVVGVGSVGLEAVIVLLEGRGDPDPLILQFKQATSSVMTHYSGKSGYERQGQRVVAGQQMMQASSDPFLGWVPFGAQDLYVRQLRDMKGATESSSRLPEFSVDCEIAASTLARAHARSVDPSVVHGYLGAGKRLSASIAEFAASYADQAEADYELFKQAISAGRLAAETGV